MESKNSSYKNVPKRNDNGNDRVSWRSYWDFQTIVIHDSKSREIKRKIEKQILFMVLRGDSIIRFFKKR